MYIRKMISAVLAMVFAGTAMTSCSHQATVEMPFCV